MAKAKFPSIERVRVRGGGASHTGPRLEKNGDAFAFIEDDGAAMAIVAGGISATSSGRNAADLTIETASEIFRGRSTSVLDDLAEIWWRGEHGTGEGGARPRPYTSLPIADRVELRERVSVVLAGRVPDSMGDVAVLEAESRSVLAIPERALERANASIYRRSEQSRPGWRGTGASAACVVFASKQASIAHVGDGRVYLVRDASIEALTSEHTLRNEFVDSHPDLSTADAAHIPANVIVRALGMKDTVALETHTLPILSGDMYLLATDGLWLSLSSREIHDAVRRHRAGAAKALVEHGSKGRPDHPGENLAVVVVEIL